MRQQTTRKSGRSAPYFHNANGPCPMPMMTTSSLFSLGEARDEQVQQMRGVSSNPLLWLVGGTRSLMIFIPEVYRRSFLADTGVLVHRHHRRRCADTGHGCFVLKGLSVVRVVAVQWSVPSMVGDACFASTCRLRSCTYVWWSECFYLVIMRSDSWFRLARHLAGERVTRGTTRPG